MAQKHQTLGFLDELKAIFSPKSQVFSHPPSLLAFYSVFMEEKALLSIQILEYEKVYGKDFKPFTVYNIKVKTKTHEFKLSKRYSDFYFLHKTLKNHYPFLIGNWNFPQKNIWGNFDNEVLEQRKLQFQNYLDFLSEGYVEHNAIEFLDFLEINKIFNANNKVKNKSGLVGAFRNEENNSSNVTQNVESVITKQNISEEIENEKVFQFLWNLNYSTDNYITIFNEYETYFLNSRPKLSLEGIKRLLLGDKSLKGLIEICGNVSTQSQNSNLHHICCKAFKVLTMLLDHEYNKEAEVYIKIYKSAGVTLITSLKLNLHIKPDSQKQCKCSALKLVDLFLSQNIEKAHERLSRILSDCQDSIKEYEKWKTSKRFSSHSTERFELHTASSDCGNVQNPLLYLSFDTTSIKRKNIPMTKWISIPLKDPKYAQFKLKHLNGENIKITTTTKTKLDDSFEKLTKMQKMWDKLLVDESKVSVDGQEIFIEKFKWWKDNPEAKTFVFIHKRVFEKSEFEKKLSKLSISYDYSLQENEVLLSMNLILDVKKNGARKKGLRNVCHDSNLTKIELTIKEIKESSKDELMPEITGVQNRFVDNLVTFKSFLEEENSPIITIQPIIKSPPRMFKTLLKPNFISISPFSSDDEDSTLPLVEKALRQNEEYQRSLLEMLSLIETRLHLNNLKLDLYETYRKLKKGSSKRRFWEDKIAFYQFDDDSDKIPEALRVLKMIRSQQKKKTISHFLTKIMQELDENSEDFSEDDYFSSSSVIPKPLKPIKVEPLLSRFISILPKKDPQEINWISLAKKVNFDNLKSSKSHEKPPNQESALEPSQPSQAQMQDLNDLNAVDFSPYFEWNGRPPSVITGLQLYKAFISFHKTFNIQTKWTKEDDEMLQKAVMRHGVEDWKQIANYLDGKDTGACFQRWFKYVNPAITKGKWTILEDIKLALYLEYYGKGKWSIIAKKFSNRTDVQIRERWCNILDPNLKTGNKWKPEEDEILLKEAPKNNFKWSLIAELFEGRTDNQCTRRYKKLMNSKPREEKKERKRDSNRKGKERKRKKKFWEKEGGILKVQISEAIEKKIPIFKIVKVKREIEGK